MTWDTQKHSGTSRSTSVFIPEEFLSRIIAQEWNVEPRRVELVRQFLVSDPVIEGVLTRLAIEAQHGSPSGQLYAESACEFIAHHVIREYSSLTTHPRRARGGLAGRDLRIILDYIQDSLAQPITLRALAELVGLSPRHFERAFCQAVGVPVHAYVMAQRVAAAQQLLLDEPSLAVEQVAARAGFSSSSHFAAVLRRQTGYSPTTFRRFRSR